jgi:hypothetical protein
MTFPKFYKALANGESRPAMAYAIIDGGKIIATNGHIVVFSDFQLFVDNAELAEGKVFDCDLLKWMAKKEFNRLECTKTGIIAYSTKNKPEERPYTGYFKIKRRKNEAANMEYDIRPMYLYSKKTLSIGNYPDWKTAIPNDCEYKEATGINNIGFDAHFLSIVMDCFARDTKEFRLKFEFLTKEKAVRISPLNEIYGREGNQSAILMPVAISD